ncbi:hypothetical protein [Methylobacterium aerolatum]|uniref:Helix-turn-helix domain-containing protein n=1 Tax=Methylobacterium aerolatum TaxID=418708 RepID=A0ABU0HXB1_9HYPH|nr:hypothetical protein [Methylobacterium aerolatum]MDQ0446977.1 hypothetical protein [Methylobacterium aerolatum]GJD36768.1 hypothetical protein FMGBMHLM_3691 [Methylobacterium aerolatum]
MAITTKAALAAELKISKARVSQYVKAGMPVRSDGKLNREQALNWINRTQASQTVQDKGVVRARQLAPDRPRLLRSPPPLGAYEPEVEIARSIIGKAEAIVAQSAITTGASLEVAYVLSVMIASALDGAASDALAEHGFEGFAKGFTVGELCSTKDFPAPDWTALAQRCGGVFDEDACERRLAQIEASA